MQVENAEFNSLNGLLIANRQSTSRELVKNKACKLNEFPPLRRLSPAAFRRSFTP